MPVGPCCGEEQEAVLPEVVHPDPYVGDDQLQAWQSLGEVRL